MKTYDFINSNIGNDVYITPDRDLAFRGELKPLIFNKTKLKLIKLTKHGMAYLQDEKTGYFYSVQPSNVREYSELKFENEE